jgi:outer membrane lipoprotein-sorting protein
VKDRQNKAIDDLLDRATEALRRVPVPEGPPPEAVACAISAGLAAPVSRPPVTARKGSERRTRGVGRLARIVAAASILAALGLLASWLAIGGSSNLAFAKVVDVLASLRSATFDVNMRMTGQTDVTVAAKGFFLSPTHQRFEGVEKVARYGDMVVIADYESAKGIVLLPKQKIAVVVDSEKIKDQIDNPMTCMFETMRCLVREGRNRLGEKGASIGKKEIDGHTVVGFLVRSSMGDMTLWADPQTARPVRIELNMPAMKARGILSNFRYNVELDPALFSLEPPPGYSTHTMSVVLPMEEGLIQTLRVVAEQSDGMFPKKLGMNSEVMGALQTVARPDIDEIATSDDETSEGVLAALPIEQKYLQGILFYLSLKPENDPHYVGRGVKLGTPDRPIFWYKPSDAERCRVIYADLSVREMTAEEVKKLSPGETK